jgi:hypothetical protein
MRDFVLWTYSWQKPEVFLQKFNRFFSQRLIIFYNYPKMKLCLALDIYYLFYLTNTMNAAACLPRSNFVNLLQTSSQMH